MTTSCIIYGVVTLAFFFDFVNGFHDTANTVATALATKALTPQNSILLACLANFAGALSFTGVARTIGGGIVEPQKVPHGLLIVLSALVAATLWNLVTWYLGVPSSSSHALIGALLGALIICDGVKTVNWSGFSGILTVLLFSPLLAFALGFLVMSLFSVLLYKKNRLVHNHALRRMQALTSVMESFGHGTNDAQKSMGIITFALVTGGWQTTLAVPAWVRVLSSLAITAGTAAGGWRIIKTVARTITRLEPVSGLAADLGAITTIFCSTVAGMPVSTSHIVSSSIAGAGSARRFSAVRWTTAKKLAIFWLCTLPASALLAGIIITLGKILAAVF